MRLRQFVNPLLGLALVASLSVQANAGTFITSATKISGNGTAINVLDAGLVEGVEAYTDRTHVLVNIPDELESTDATPADLIQVSNDDKSSDPYQIDVTIGRPAILYVGLDDRNTPQPRPWMNDTGLTGLASAFIDTGEQIDIDESNDGDIDQSFSLWAAFAPAGTYSLYENSHGGNNYIIFADNKLVPEPSSAILIGLGMLGLGMIRRRR